MPYTALDDFVAPIVSTLQIVVAQLKQLQAIGDTGQTNLNNQAGRLTGSGAQANQPTNQEPGFAPAAPAANDGPSAYQGLAAETFSQAVAKSMVVGQERLEAIEDALGASNSCLNALESALETADLSVEADALGQILPNITLDEVVQQGAGVIDEVMVGIRQRYIDDRANYYVANSPPGGESPQRAAEDDYESEFGSTVNALEIWAATLQSAIAQWRGDMANATLEADHWEPDLVPETEQQLAEMIFAQYGTGKPIGITQTGPNTLLVTLAGVEGAPNQANTLINAADLGMGVPGDPYDQDVYKAIEAYLAAHPEIKRPVHIVIAGHSYGGMVAQELAHQQTNFTVDQVITFGSPNVAPHVSGVRYTQYYTRYDAVPRLASYQAISGSSETLVPDVGNDPNPAAWIDSDHKAYPNSEWLSQQPLPFTITDMGATSYYAAPPPPDNNNPPYDTGATT